MAIDDFSRLASEHQSRIYTFSYYYLGAAQDAEDVTQEVLVRLWRHHQSVETGKLKSWTMSVTRNCCIDVLRKRKRQRDVIGDLSFDEAAERIADDTQGPSDQTELSDLRGRLQDAMAQLEEPYRSALVMREVQQHSYGEISEALEVPLNTVKSHIHRGRQMLRDLLRKESLCEHA